MLSEVEMIQAEITRHRAKNDQLQAAQATQGKVVTAMRQQVQRMRDEFEKQLAAELEKVAAASASANELINEQTKNKALIAELQAKLAKALESDAAKKQLEEIEDDVARLLETLPAWTTNAAPYQKQGVLEIYRAYFKGLNGFALFDDMGLGKTFQAILALHLLRLKFQEQHGRLPRILWLTAKNLIKGTVREFQQWSPTTPIYPLSFGVGKVVTAKDRTFLFTMGMQLNAVLIGNYEVLNTMPEVRATDWDFVIIDEVSKLKGGANPTPTKIWKAAKEVCIKARFTVMLSGTPMENHPKEMWSYLHIFDPERFDSLRRFEMLFSVNDPIKGLVISADKLLQNALVGQCIRRRRDEVGLQLPEKIRTPYFLTMGEEQRAVADMMATSFYVWLGGVDDNKPLSAAAIIARLTRLRQINVWPPSIQKEVFDEEHPEGFKLALECRESSKIDQAMELIETMTDQDEQVVLFCTFNEPLFEIQRRCQELGVTCKVMYGGSSESNIEAEFQQGEVQVFCCNSAMGKGMNLQKNKEFWPGGASHAIFLDLWWSPARNEQCEDRIHRRGALDTCQIHLLYNEDSVDQFMVQLIEDKASQFANILERQEIRPASEWKRLLADLVKG